MRGPRRAGQAFLWIVVCQIVMTPVLLILLYRYHISFSFAVSLLTTQLPTLLIALATVRADGVRFQEVLPFHRIRISTMLLCVLYMLLSLPAALFLNMVSMLFTENVVADASEQFLAMPFGATFVLIGFLAPFCEECVFRGVELQSLKESGRTLGAMVLSSVLFGLMHMNLNQAGYAIVVGFLMAMLVEATGSLLASLTFHISFNTLEIILMYLADAVPEADMELAEEAAVELNLFQRIAGVVFLAAVAGLGLWLAAQLAVRIARQEGREAYYRAIFQGRRGARGRTDGASEPPDHRRREEEEDLSAAQEEEYEAPGPSDHRRREEEGDLFAARGKEYEASEASDHRRREAEAGLCLTQEKPRPDKAYDRMPAAGKTPGRIWPAIKNSPLFTAPMVLGMILAAVYMFL